MAYKQQKSIIKGTDAHKTAISETNSPAKHFGSLSHNASHVKKGVQKAYKSTKKSIQKGYKAIKPAVKIGGKIAKKLAGPVGIYFTVKEGIDLTRDVIETGSLKKGFKKHVAEDYGIGSYESEKKISKKGSKKIKSKVTSKSKKTKSEKSKTIFTKHFETTPKSKKTKSSSSKTPRGLDMTHPYNRAYVKGKQMGYDLNDLVRQRKSHKKGSAEYATIQNKINRAYGVSKRH